MALLNPPHAAGGPSVFGVSMKQASLVTVRETPPPTSWRPIADDACDRSCHSRIRPSFLYVDAPTRASAIERLDVARLSRVRVADMVDGR